MIRRNLALWSASVALASFGAILVLRFNPLGVLRPCPLRALTGVPCPTCGGTLALSEMLHGRLTEALRANPMVTITSIIVAGSGAVALALIPWAPRLRSPRWPSGAILLGGALLLIFANWVYLFLSTR